MFDQTRWPEAKRKRTQDDEEAAGTGFTEHRNKRLHSLPLRTSSTQKRWSHPPSFPANNYTLPSTITPADSDSEDQWPAACRHRSIMDDADMAMETEEEPGHATQHLNRGSLQSAPIGPGVTGRMPTPIHCTFAAQIRGNNWPLTNQAMHEVNQTANAAANQNSGFGNMHTGVSQPQVFLPAEDPSVPRSLDGVGDWSMVQSRRLPSPISESGGAETPASPGMALDSCSPSMSQLSLQRPHLPHHAHSSHSAMALHPNLDVVTPPPADTDMGMMDMDDQEAQSPSSAPATPSPRSKFGHSRSKHTLNTWTLQPGMKKSFSIGYRADCEKCRLKVPGHFNHIIVS